jgi:hypothetical protein
METTRLQKAGSPSALAARQRRSPSGPAVARPSMARLTGTVRRSIVPDIERSTTHCHAADSARSCESRTIVIESSALRSDDAPSAEKIARSEA